MKFTKAILAVALAAASTGAMAVPVAWTGTFAMYNPVGGQLDANDGASGVVALVTGFIDVAAGTFSLASTDTFFGLPWTTSGGTLFGPGTYTVSTVDPAPGVSGGTYSFTVGAGQMGGVIDFAGGRPPASTSLWCGMWFIPSATLPPIGMVTAFRGRA